MEIFTSYFGNHRNYKNPIAICGKSPAYYSGFEYKKLAPKYDFFKSWKDGLITNDEYVIEYKKTVLDCLDVNRVVEELKSFYPDDQDITLVCYEKPSDFCHRHLVADWLNQNGYPTREVSIK